MASLDDILTTQKAGVTVLNSIKQSIDAAFPNWVDVPATATSPGVAGQVAYDTGFYYVCVSSNTWKRTALVTF